MKVDLVRRYLVEEVNAEDLSNKELAERYNVSVGAIDLLLKYGRAVKTYEWNRLVSQVVAKHGLLVATKNLDEPVKVTQVEADFLGTLDLSDDFAKAQATSLMTTLISRNSTELVKDILLDGTTHRECTERLYRAIYAGCWEVMSKPLYVVYMPSLGYLTQGVNSYEVKFSLDYTSNVVKSESRKELETEYPELAPFIKEVERG